MIKFKLEEGVTLPEYKSEGAVGMDVSAHSILKVFKGDTEVEPEKLKKIKEGFKARGFIKLRSLERILFSTGIQVADLPANIELQVRSRSGISLKRGLVVMNQPGTIDPDYRGVVGVIIYNSTPFLNQIAKGERIAQLVPKEVIKPEVVESEEITETKRGEGGFGSTNIE